MVPFSPMAVRRLIRLRPGEWFDLARAQIALIAAQVDVWRRPIGRLVAPVCSGDPTPVNPESEASARRLALAVTRAADHGLFRPLCLVRALALSRLLQARGIHGSRIRVGVRKSQRFSAHAWVEWGHLVLDDTDSHTHRYARLTDVRAARGH